MGQLSVFAGTFGLPQAAEVCGGGDQAAALEVIDRLAGKSLVAAEPADLGERQPCCPRRHHRPQAGLEEVVALAWLTEFAAAD